MKLNRLIRNVAVFATAALISGIASSYTIFFGEDLGLGEAVPQPARPNATAASTSFLSNLIGVGTETFEGFAAGTGSPLALTFPGAGTATLGGSGTIQSVAPGTTNGFGRYAISGTNFWEVSSGDFTITFSAAVAAFGFWGVDIGDFDGQITLELANGGTTNLVVNNTLNGPGGSVLFYGLIAQNPGELFTSITFGNTNPGVDFFAFDDMTIGSIEQVRPVPEPDSLLLVGLALTIAAGVARLRRRKS
jgi:PEP-CTERM motif